MVQTLQPEQAGEDAGARTRHGASWSLRAAGRALIAVVAVLAFGVFGLIAVVWRGVRGTKRSQHDCRSCRRRRYLTVAGTSALAALVVVGAGLSVHQHTSGPNLPTCGTARPAHVQGPLGVSPLEVDAGKAWSKGRQIVTAPVSGLTRHYVNDRGGGLCEVQSMTVGLLPSAAADSGVAVGGVVLIDTKARTTPGDWEALAHHESRHVTQWAALTLAGGPLAMPVLYAVDDAFFPDSRNHFERAADLQDGGYPPADGLGPDPQWPNAAVVGLLLFVVFRRRLRWASRALIGGRAATIVHQEGLCPLHSKGWFRLRPRAMPPISHEALNDHGSSFARPDVREAGRVLR